MPGESFGAGVGARFKPWIKSWIKSWVIFGGKSAALFLSLCAASGAQAQEVPLPGRAAPAFSLPDQNGNRVTLDGLRGKWIVLYFYPKNDTPGCTEEACAFRDDIAELQALGAEVLGVSIAETASNAEFSRKYHLPFSLLADRDGAVARRYGAYADWMVVRFAKRYTFLIDPQGKIAKTYLKVDTAKHSAEIIADLKRLSLSAEK